jgi:hypothetical protein
MFAMTACSTTPEPSSLAVGVTSPARSALRDVGVATNLGAVAREQCAAAGVASPATMHAVVASNHQAAETVVSGAIINDHVPVYVVQMTGGPFIVPHHPPHRSAPVGDVLTVTFDAATYRVLDIGYDSVAPDLSRIDSDVVDLMAP